MPAQDLAYQVGAKGSAHSEAERELFEAYMRGHCWQVGTWLPDQQGYEDCSTRMLFAVWRDRAALADQLAAQPTSGESHGGDDHRR